MEEEAPDELGGVHGHGPGAIIFGAFFIGEGNLPIVYRGDAVIGDGYPMGVPGQVFQDLFRSGEGVF